jgi:hypothetical protein
MPTTEPTGRLQIVVSPHWVNKIVLLPLARPYARVDDREIACRWNAAAVVDVTPGHHDVEVFIRYKGADTPLGRGDVGVDVAAGDTVRIEARNGWMNQTPFRPRVLAAADQP